MATILLIDDSKTLLKYIKRMLVDAGHDVLAVSSGREGLDFLTSSSFDLVVTDLYMPAPDGFEVLDAIRRREDPIPVIVMSTHARACDIFRDGSALGASASLTKPFNMEELVQTVDAVLNLTANAAEPGATAGVAAPVA